MEQLKDDVAGFALAVEGRDGNLRSGDAIVCLVKQIKGWRKVVA
jgi:hypothetical protein